jgi:ABC-2 type transport system ATP-binding protein
LAAAILHNPKVLILDEPTTGLDPNQLVEIRALIRALGKDKTVLFSTHIMQEVEAVCDRVIIIKQGELLVDKKLAELKEDHQQVIVVTFDYKIEEQFISRLPNVVSYKNNYDNTWYVTFESDKDMRPAIFDFAQENGLKILELNTQNKNLETLFREVTSA